MHGPMSRLVAAAVAACAASGFASASPFDDLLRRIPDHANAVLCVNTRAILNSPLGRKNDWSEECRRKYVAGLTDMPPATERMVVGLHFDPSTLQPTWRLEVVQLSKPVKPEGVARRLSSTVDTVEKVPVVLSPGRAYFVVFAPEVMAEACPPDRQKLGRWVRFCQENSRPVVTRYLQQAAEDATGARAVFAIDLKDLFDPEGIDRRLKDASFLRGKKVDRAGIAKALLSVQGARITVGVDRDITGEIRVDFGDSALPLAPVGKDFILAAMAAIGAALEDVDKWQIRVEDHALVLSGPLTREGARLLLSPAANHVNTATYAELSASGDDPPDPKAAAALKYYRSMTAILEDVRGKKAPSGSDQYTQLWGRSLWYKQAATKLDSLPILNVDPELVKLNILIAQTMRGLGNVASSAKTQTQMATAQYSEGVVSGYGGGYGYGGYGYGGYGYAVNGAYAPGWGYGYGGANAAFVTNAPQVASMLASTAVSEKGLREQTWLNVDNALANMRKYLTEKYKVEF